MSKKPLTAEYVSAIFNGAQRALADVTARRKWGNSKQGSPVATVELCAEIARMNRQIEDAEIELAGLDAIIVYYVSKNWPSYTDREHEDKIWKTGMMDFQKRAFARHIARRKVATAPANDEPVKP